MELRDRLEELIDSRIWMSNMLVTEILNDPEIKDALEADQDYNATIENLYEMIAEKDKEIARWEQLKANKILNDPDIKRGLELLELAPDIQKILKHNKRLKEERPDLSGLRLERDCIACNQSVESILQDAGYKTIKIAECSICNGTGKEIRELKWGDVELKFEKIIIHTAFKCDNELEDRRWNIKQSLKDEGWEIKGE